MAWTDQCRIAFKANAEGLLWRQEKETKKNLMRILAQLSEDSGIPQKTLYHWWREEEKRKEKSLNFQTPEENGVSVENDSENETEQIPEIPEIPTCIRCRINPAEIMKRTGKPVGVESQYYGLCGSCRKKHKAIKVLDEDVKNDNGILTICPKCNHAFYINKERTNGG